MARLRNAVMAVALGAGMTGCSHLTYSRISIFHCDACDDFPTPAYGPGFSMAPGTYTGPPVQDSVGPNRPAISNPAAGTSPATEAPGASSAPTASPTPPPPPMVTPGQAAGER